MVLLFSGQAELVMQAVIFLFLIFFLHHLVGFIVLGSGRSVGPAWLRTNIIIIIIISCLLKSVPGTN